MRNRNTTVWKLFAEVFLIVLGVLLGLFLNEMRLEQRNAARARVALEQITEELRFNRGQMADIAPHHVTVRDSLGALLARVADVTGEIPILDVIHVAPGGFGVARLRSHAWGLATELGTLEELDFTVASELSMVYDLQAMYLEYYTHLSANIFQAENIGPDARRGLVLGLTLLASDIVHCERDLLNQYDAVLARLDAGGP